MVLSSFMLSFMHCIEMRFLLLVVEVLAVPLGPLEEGGAEFLHGRSDSLAKPQDVP